MIAMHNQITTRPNPFVSSITLEITTTEDKPGVVRMAGEDGRIYQLFLWQLKKGINISNISNLNRLASGKYMVDVMDQDGRVLCSTRVVK
jgi:hypothetical protein